MHVIPVTTTQQWRSIADRWNHLARKNPFCQWEWLSTWWNHFGVNRELCILTVYDDQSALIGAVPWYIERTASFGAIVRPLGSGEICSEYVTIFGDVRYEQAVVEAIADVLIEGLRVPGSARITWDLLALEWVPAADSATQRLVTCLEKSGCFIEHVPQASCWRIDLPATWPAYLSLLSKSHRKQLKHLIRDLWDTGRATWWTAQDTETLSHGMNLLEELHQRRWKAAGRPGVFDSRRFRDFLFDVAPRLLASGVLRLVVLEIDGQPAAVDFHVVTGETNFVYQGGFDPELAGNSPGALITALLIQDSIAQGKKHFDFLRGDELYKPHFRATPVPTHDIHVVPPRTSSQIRHGLWRTGVTMKNLFKSGISLAGMQ